MDNPDFTTLTRRPDPHRPYCWRIYWTDVCVGWVAKMPSIGGASEWIYRIALEPGMPPGAGRGGSADSFEQAREKFLPAWLKFAAARTPEDFEAWRDHDRMTREKYARFDKGERMPVI